MDDDTYNTLHSFNNNNESQLNMKRYSSQGNYNINNSNSTQDKTYCLNDNVFSNTIEHNEIVHNINENQNELKNQNNFYEDNLELNYLEFLWKIEIPAKDILTNYIEIQKHTSREGMKYLIGIVYIYNKVKENATVIFATKLENKEANETNFVIAMHKIKIEFENELSKDNYEQINMNNNNIKNNNEQQHFEDFNVVGENKNVLNNNNNNTDNVLISLTNNKDNSLGQTESSIENPFSYETNDNNPTNPNTINYVIEERNSEHFLNNNNNKYNGNNQHESHNSIVNLLFLQQNTNNNILHKQSENIIKNIISNHPELFHNQYLQTSNNKNKPPLNNINTNIHPSYYMKINFLSPNRNISSTEILNISRPSKIILSFFIIENISSNITNLTVLIRNKIDKLKEKSYNHVGIFNEGMTCYMNSMIQSLNVLSYFKRGIFSIPYDNSDKSLSYSLQQLFYDLTFGNETASTKKLIQSFGWNNNEIFIQHDVQEFNMMFSDLMEKKLKGTNNEKVFTYLFEGKICSGIECINYKFQSIKEEKFIDLQLNVKGCKNIYESFNKYTEKEILDNEDKYEVEGHGKEKAIKSTIFSKFPPVLILQLKRFEYNHKLNSMDKVNDLFEFYDTINLSKYLKHENLNEYNNNEYKLLSVVVHQGNIYGGHYYAYTRFDVSKDEWYCFNDDRVCKADVYEVFENNFGGTRVINEYNQETNYVFTKAVQSDFSAYVLIYIQASKAEEILKPMNIKEIPVELINQIKQDKRQINMINVYYLNECMLKNYHGLGIGKGVPKIINRKDINIQLNRIIKEDSLLTSFITIPRTITINELYTIFTNLTSLSLKEISLFLVIFRTEATTKFNSFTMHFLENNEQLRLENIIHKLNDNNERPMYCVIYLDYSFIKSYEPIIHNIHSYEHHNNYVLDENNLPDEKKIQINDKISIYIPNYIPYIFNTFNHQSSSIQQYKRKILIYKVLTNTNHLNVLKTLNVCVNENGAIEQNSIIQMKTIEKDIFSYYIKIYNISPETLNKSETFGIAFFIETLSKKHEETPYKQIPYENMYILSYDSKNFEVNYINQNIIELINDFNEIFYQTKSTDCLIIIPILYIGTQLIHLRDFLNEFLCVKN